MVRDVLYVGWRCFHARITCVASPTKKNKTSRFCGQIHYWKHVYLRFFPTTLRNFPVTPASPLMRKFTAPRSTLWCYHYSGKEAAVFVSSRHRDFVAEVGKCGSRSLDLFFLVLWLSFLLLLHRWAVLVRTRKFRKISYNVTFFSSSTALKTHS